MLWNTFLLCVLSTQYVGASVKDDMLSGVYMNFGVLGNAAQTHGMLDVDAANGTSDLTYRTIDDSNGPLDDIDELMRSPPENLRVGTDCEFKVSKSGKVLTLTRKEGCRSPPLIEKFLEKFDTHFSGTLKSKTDDIIDSQKLQVDNIIYNQQRKVVNFACSSDEVYYFIYPYLKLDSLEITIEIPFINPEEDDDDVTLSKLKIDAKGQFKIRGQDSTTILTKPSNTETFSFEIETTSIGPNDLSRTFGGKLGEMTNANLGFDSSKLESLSFGTHPTVRGSWTKDIGFQIVCYDKVSGTPAFDNAEVFFIISKGENMNRPNVAFVALVTAKRDGNMDSPAAALARFLTYDITDVPLLKSISQSYIMIISDGKIPLLDDSEFKKIFEKFINNGDVQEIPSGIHIRVFLNIRDAVKNCKENAVITGLPGEYISVGFELNPFGISHYFPPDLKFDAVTFLKCLSPNIRAELPSVLFGQYRAFDVKHFTFNPKGPSFKVHVIMPGTLVVREKSDFKFEGLEMVVSRDAQGGWEFSASTTAKIGELEAAISIGKSSGDGFTFNAMFKKISTAQIEKMIGITDENKGIGSFILNGLEFEIDNLRVDIKIGGGSKEFRMAGSPIFLGLDKISIEGLVWDIDRKEHPNQPGVGFCLGIVIRNIRFDQIINKVLGTEYHFPGWLTDLTAVVMYSNADRNPEDVSTASTDATSGSSSGGSSSRQGTSSHSSGITKDSPKTPNQENSRARINTIKRAKAAADKREQQKNDRNDKDEDEDEEDSSSSSNSSSKNDGDGKDDDADEDEEAEGMQILEMKGLEIQKGLTVQAHFQIPGDLSKCRDSVICEFLVNKLGSSFSIILDAHIRQSTVEVKGTLTGNIIITDNLALTAVSIGFRFGGLDTAIFISAELRMSDPALTFTGELEVDITGTIKLSFDMSGTWQNPFDQSDFAIGEVHLAIGYRIGMPFPNIELGGKLFFGKSGKEIILQVYVGVDPGTKSFFFGKVNGLTVKKIADAYELDVDDVPSLVQDSGFPRGLRISWTANANGINLENQDIYIPFGISMDGTLDILQYQANVSLEVSTEDNGKRHVKFTGSFDPLDIRDGLLKLRKSKEDPENGPYFLLDMGSSEFELKIYGYSYIVGIESEAAITLIATQFQTKIMGNLFGMLCAEVDIIANFGNLPSASFSFKASITIDLEKIKTAIHKVLQNAEDSAKDSLNAAKIKVRAIEQKVEAAVQHLGKKRASIESYKELLQEKVESLDEQRKEVERQCNSTCGLTCIPFFSWNEHCFKFFDTWCGCPTWNPCRWEVRDLICMAGCEMNKVGKKIVIWGEKTALQVLLGMSDVAIFVLKALEGVVKIGNVLKEVAIGVLEFAEKATETGILIGKKFTTFYLTSIRIHEMTLSASLDESRNGCAGLVFDATIFGYKVDFNEKICINLNIYANMAKNAVYKIFPALSKETEETEQLRGKMAEIKKQEDEFDAEKTSVLEEAESEVSGAAKRSSVPTENELKVIKALETPIPDYFIKNEEMMRTFIGGAPWKIMDNVEETDYLQQHPGRSNDVNIGMFKGDKSSCGQLRSAISKLDDVSSGIRSTAISVKRQRIMLLKEKQRQLEGVKYLKAKIDQIENRHNLTDYEKEDLYFWYKEIKSGTNDWIKKSDKVLTKIRKSALPSAKLQLEKILNKTNHADVRSYIQSVHVDAENALRRSDIPHPNQEEGEKHLQKISGMLTSMFHSSASIDQILDDSHGIDHHFNAIRMFTNHC